MVRGCRGAREFWREGSRGWSGKGIVYINKGTFTKLERNKGKGGGREVVGVQCVHRVIIMLM